MNTRKVIITGGGVSGLAAGIYLKLNGNDTLMFKKMPNLAGCVAVGKENDAI